MNQTYYRLPLPHDAIAFSSPDGRRLLGEASAEGAAWTCTSRLPSSSIPSPILRIAVPGRRAQCLGGRARTHVESPWRWFAEDLLNCCVPLADVRRRGLDLDELGRLARCNGADLERTALMYLASTTGARR